MHKYQFYVKIYDFFNLKTLVSPDKTIQINNISKKSNDKKKKKMEKKNKRTKKKKKKMTMMVMKKKKVCWIFQIGH